MQEEKKGIIIQTKTVTISEFKKLLNNGTLRKKGEEKKFNQLKYWKNICLIIQNTKIM